MSTPPPEPNDRTPGDRTGANRTGSAGPQRTGRAKERAARIRPEYIREADTLTRWKWALSLTAAGACVLWLAWGVEPRGLTLGVAGGPTTSDAVFTPVGRLRSTHGELARVHAAWETDCRACHIPFAPINQDSLAADLFPVAARLSDAKCAACHAAASHHANLAGTEAACAACHRDHRGAGHDLNAVADTACTACHAALGSHRKGAMPNDADHPAGWLTVTAFAPGRHPAFGGGDDPGHLKFNHALHLAPGMPGRTDGYFRYRDLPEADRGRYLAENPTAGPDTLVDLSCGSCHETARRDGDGVASGGGTVLGDGKRFLPVAYERHCAACHGIEVDPAVRRRGDAADRVAAPIALPHGLQPAALDPLLAGAVALRVLGDDPTLFAALDKVRLRSAGRDVTAALRTLAAARERVAGTADLDDPAFGLTRLRRSLYGGDGACTKCHFYGGENREGGLPLSETLPPGFDFSTDQTTNLAVAPANVPAVWYGGALFDHTAHRGMSCAACHPGAEPAGAFPTAVPAGGWLAQVRAENLIPGSDNCLSCHTGSNHTGSGGSRVATDEVETGDTATTGVRNGCAVCHVYHAADRQPVGLDPPWTNPDGRGLDFLTTAAGRPTAGPSNAGPSTAVTRAARKETP